WPMRIQMAKHHEVVDVLQKERAGQEDDPEGGWPPNQSVNEMSEMLLAYGGPYVVEVCLGIAGSDDRRTRRSRRSGEGEEGQAALVRASFLLAMAKKVFVSGCYDLLHSGHVCFFQEAARYGDLYVALGSDRTIRELKKRPPVNSEDERLYMVQ